MSANRLNSTPLPSITGLPASGPMLPSPSTAVPLVTTADQVALGGVLVRQARIALDREAGNRDARRVGQAQIALGEAGLGGADRDLTRGRRGVVFERIFIAQFHSFSSANRSATKANAKPLFDIVRIHALGIAV